MVVHWIRERGSRWQMKLLLNGGGMVLTGVVTVVVTVAKAPTSLLVAVIIPILVLMMLFINRQYRASAEHLAVRPDAVIPAPRRDERVIVPVPGINRAVVQAINVAAPSRPTFAQCSSRTSPKRPPRSASAGSASCRTCRWSSSSRRIGRWSGRCSPTSTSSTRHGQRARKLPITFVVVPEYVARSWWERLLFNQSANRLRRALIGRPHTVVVNVPYRREDDEEEEQAEPRPS